MKISEDASGADAKLIGTHSLGEGGGKSLYVRGVDAPLIQSFGRSESETFLRCQFYDEIALVPLAAALEAPAAMLAQLLFSQ